MFIFNKKYELEKCNTEIALGTDAIGMSQMFVLHDLFTSYGNTTCFQMGIYS